LDYYIKNSYLCDMKKIIEDWDFEEDMEEPYIEEKFFHIIRKYNPNYGDDRICKCGHPYYRHFDTYDDMFPCGCKYCRCDTFKEKEETL